MAHLESVISSSKDGLVEVREVITGLTLDVFASCSFAIETNTNSRDRSAPNALLEHALPYFDISAFTAISYYSMPKWFNQLVGVSHFFRPSSLNYFENLSKELLRQRKEAAKEVVTKKRTDFLDILVNASADEAALKNTSWDELTADMDKDGMCHIVEGQFKSGLCSKNILFTCFIHI